VLALCTRAFVERGGTIGFFEPSYSLYPVLAAIQDVATKSVRLNAIFRGAMEPGYAANLFFMANPNAPTGIQYPRETVDAFCRNSPGVVLVDEAYVDFADYDCASLALSLPNVLVARTLSKSSSLAGLRLGYALGSASLIEALYKIKDSYNLDRLTQELGRAAIEDSEHLRRNAEKNKSDACAHRRRACAPGLYGAAFGDEFPVHQAAAPLRRRGFLPLCGPAKSSSAISPANSPASTSASRSALIPK